MNNEERMTKIGQAIDTVFNPPGKPKTIGFVLLLFAFGDHDHRCNYMSNAKREDVKTMLREQLSYFEGMPEGEPPRTPQ